MQVFKVSTLVPVCLVMLASVCLSVYMSVSKYVNVWLSFYPYLSLLRSFLLQHMRQVQRSIRSQLLHKC